MVSGAAWLLKRPFWIACRWWLHKRKEANVREADIWWLQQLIMSACCLVARERDGALQWRRRPREREKPLGLQRYICICCCCCCCCVFLVKFFTFLFSRQMAWKSSLATVHRLTCVVRNDQKITTTVGCKSFYLCSLTLSSSPMAEIAC